MKNTFIVAVLSGLFLSTPAFSDIVQQDDVIIQGSSIAAPGRLCVGNGCVDGESFPGGVIDSVIRMHGNNNILQFLDNSSSSFPDRDWAIQINEPGGGAAGEAFIIKDDTSGTAPFRINGGASDNAFAINSAGDIGFGTLLPDADVHLVTSGVANLRIESSTLGGNWDLNVGTSGLFFTDLLTSNDVMRLSNGAPRNSLFVGATGRIGMGLSNPEGKLHTNGDGVQLVYFESDDGGPVQVRFRTDSENRRFLAVDNDNNVKSQIIFLDDRINFTGQTDSGANLWLSIGPNGITSQGPTCGTPCDLTFDPEVFTVPAIEERAAYMWEHMHLPAIGPTSPDVPMNLTEKTGGIIHELEVAHIYIEQLHREIAELRANEAAHAQDMRNVLSRLDAIEAQ